MNTFKEFHPLVNFLWFLLVLGFSMSFFNPVMIAVSLFCAVFYSVLTGGAKAVKFNISVILPLALMSAVINVLFNHSGTTILFYLKNGNPITKESIVYGFVAACIIAQTVLWFYQLNFVMTDDKFVYLFGKIAPSFALVLSMTLRFVPNYKKKFDEIITARKALGMSNQKRITEAVKTMSVMVSWAFESAFDTADSMKSRGYGLKGRTAYSVFIFTKRDFAALFFTLFIGIYIIAGAFLGKLRFVFFPSIAKVDFSLYNISIYAAFFLLCLIPAVYEASEVIKWNVLKQKI